MRFGGQKTSFVMLHLFSTSFVFLSRFFVFLQPISMQKHHFKVKYELFNVIGC